MEILGAALAVRLVVVTSLVSKPSNHNCGPLLNLHPGCADKTTVECPGETFCCPVGKTCARDAAGNAVCQDPSNSDPGTTNNTNPLITDKDTNSSTNDKDTNSSTNDKDTKKDSNDNNKDNNDNNKDNNNNNNNNKDNNNSSKSTNSTSSINNQKSDASLPQVVPAWGLVVTVAFLSAFLVSPPTVSYKINPDQIRHPVLRLLSSRMQLLTLDDSPGSLSRSCTRTFLSISGFGLEFNFVMQRVSLSAPIGTGSNAQRIPRGKVIRSRSCVFGRFTEGVGRGVVFTIKRKQKDRNETYINRNEVNEEGKLSNMTSSPCVACHTMRCLAQR